MTNDEIIWKFCKSKGMNDFGASAVLANMDAESSLNPKNVQDTAIGFTDDTYTNAVDNGLYLKFVNDKYGYGLCQWTHFSRKQALLMFAKSMNASIGDLGMQLEFFYDELSKKYSSVLYVLKSAKSLDTAVISMMIDFENPYDKSFSAKNRRIKVGQKYYSKFVASAQKEQNEQMGYKYFTKGQAVKVSAHFYSTEFDCHGLGCCNQTIVNEKLIELVEQIRTHFNTPVIITSPYRCQIHNSRPSTGGAPGSRHTKGDAADIVVKGVEPRKVAQYAESIGILGIGLYETDTDGRFVHIDTRDYKSFWYGQAQKPVTTFSIYSGTTETSPSGVNLVDTILNVGDIGQSVKTLQEKLIKLGFSCGDAGADGDFGQDTFNAVKKFQKSVKLGIDGIAGQLTLAAIEKALSNSNQNKVKITANLLNVRSGAGMNYGIVSRIKKGESYSLIEEKNGWGKIKDPDGWISMKYAEKI